MITVTACKDPEAEAESVVMKLQAHKFEHRTHFRDYAILYRSNHQARIFEQYLRNQKVPYLLSGGQSFFDKAEIKDITAYLRLLANQDDDPAFIRAVTTPKRGVGGSTRWRRSAPTPASATSRSSPPSSRKASRTVCSRASSNPASNSASSSTAWSGGRRRNRRGRCCPTCSPPSVTRPGSTTTRNRVPPKPEVEERAGIHRLADEEGRGDEKTLIDLTQTIALINLLDKGESDFDGVQLSTLHAAKGLEYKHVFLVGIEEGPVAAPRVAGSGEDRGRAPADVCRHHARAAQPARHALREAAAGQGMVAVRTVALHRGNGQRTTCAFPAARVPVPNLTRPHRAPGWRQ